ncbi:MAG: SUMF1/EgtB/PvdO family nonheme iron enzyme, partial [Planctomycetes bacterium]|nr:SUMF1/EgtB/PvdO family nonheme iron enzyme [Planctomycetota bacterium]
MATSTQPLQARIQLAVLGLVLTCGQGVVAEPLAVEFAYVPTLDVQPDGPVHDFRMGRFEIRNDQFVGFLNDALANLSEPQGQYLYFDIDSGDVYIHTAQVGAVGVDGSGTLAFSASINGHIAYEAGVYRVTNASFDAHPVTGVTWFGAVKFCNWLTVSTGLPPDERAYGEGPATDSNNDWRPIVIDPTDWATRDLDGSERAALLEKLGYRLPMDAGEEVAGLYNEWYKSASARRLPDGSVVFDSIYGFGRDSILDPDANYLESGDPFEPGTAPVGFFDGINLLADGATPTHDSENGYGLYDLSGNVWEWMQDQAPSDPSLRRNRGGSWQSNAATLTIALGSERTASSAVASTGFRIVQSVPEDVLVTPFPGIEAEGLWGGPYDDPFSDRATYRLTNVVDDSTFVLVTAPAWVSVEPAAILTPPGLSVEPATSLEVTVSLTPACDDGLTIGANLGTVTFMNGDSDRIMATRSVSLTVREPVELNPTEDFSPRMVFGGTPIPRSTFYQLGNASDKTVRFSVNWEETTEEPTGRAWLTLNDAESTSGEILSHDVASIQARIDADEAALLEPGVYTADLTFTDDCTGAEFVRIVTLTVDAPFEVTPTDDVESSGVFGGPFVPPAHQFTVSNPLDVPVSWTLTVAHEPKDSTECGPPEELWLEPLTAGGTLGPDESVDVEVTITSAAERLEACRHSLTLRFEDPGSGFVVARRVTLDVTGLRVDPPQDVEFRGPLAGPFLPEEFVYTLHNVGQPELTWSASIEIDDAAGVAWLAVTPSSGVILDPDGTDTAVLSMTGEAASLPPGTYRGSVTFTPNDTEAAEAVREVTLIVGGEAFKVTMANIGPGDVQPGGPDHYFRIGVHEITNAQYARFLNDVFRNQTLERAQYVYHDTDSGSVYINDAATGNAGTDAPSPSLTTLLYNASSGRISFDAALPDPYVIEAGFGEHPVVGVSWYGAAKFCNWMTLVQGMPAEAQVYSEGVTVDFWEPVQSDRAAMLAQPGFRLSMDNGAGTADLFNEWYKAASARPPDEETISFGAIYGFGQDVLTGADANFLDSGDTSEDETTPVGFFDGVNTLLGGALTSDTANGYGLYDLCGNVAEWMHDRVGTGEFSSGATRGGHFKSDSDFAQLRTDTRSSLPAASTFAFVGFRVAQSLRPVALIVRPLKEELSVQGPAGGLFSRDTFLLQLENRTNYTLDDLTITIDVPWLDFDGPLPQQVPPEATVELALRLTDEADLLIPQQPAGVTAQSESANVATAGTSVVTPLDADFGTASGTQQGVLNHDRVTRPDPLLPIRKVEPGMREPEPIGHVGTITITDGIADVTVKRRVVLLVHEPLSMTPEERWEATGPYCFDFAGPSRTYTVLNESASDMPWVLEVDQDWLTLAGPDGELSGSLPGGGDQTIPFTLSFNEAANILPPGEHVATVTLRNTFTERTTTRDAMITVDWPITVEWSDPQPEFSAIWRGPVEGPENLTLTISRCEACEAACPLTYRVETDASWLSVEPESELTGSVPPPGESITLTVTITEAAAGLGVDDYEGIVRIIVTDPEQGPFPDPLEITTDLTIFDPIAISAEAERWEIGCELQIADPPRRTYTLTNRHLADEIGVSVSVDVDWIEVEPTELTILPGAAADVTFSITEGAPP